MAGAEDKISAAWRMSLADSTSARAALEEQISKYFDSQEKSTYIIFASPTRLLCAAMDKES